MPSQLKLRHVVNLRSLRILWLLYEIGCEFELELIPTASLREALHPEVAPALTDDDVTIHETGAMTEWLCETRARHLWRMPGANGRIGWLDWLHFGETLAAKVAIRPAEAGNPKEARSPELDAALDTLSRWLEKSDWLLEEFSGVDCQVGYSLWVTSQANILKGHPSLSAYLQRCGDRPAFRKAIALQG